MKLLCILFLLSGAACAQVGNEWPTYNGDYSGRHYSALKEIDTTNAHNLSLAWIFRTTSSEAGAVLGGDPALAAAPNANPRGGDIKAIPLMVDGVLYFSTPGHAFAVDALTGEQIWHYVWRGRGVIGNRGMGKYGNWLYMQTGDNRIVSLDAANGHERWHHDLVSDVSVNFSTSAPVIVGNHVIVGVAGDGGSGRGWVESLDPETGEVQWKWMVTPEAGDPALATWPGAEAAAKGAGGVWQQPTYDPDLHLMYITTGQPTPTFNGRARVGSNLYTSSVVALNPDTGRMAWFYQFSPHDTHDWDSTQVPVLIDGMYEGQPRKLLAQANRNGYYYLLDRTNGKALVVTKFIATANAYTGLDAAKVLTPDAAKEPSPAGSLVFPDSDGAANYPSPSFDPQTSLFYFNATNAASIFYVGPEGRGYEWHTGLFNSSLLALDYRTGAVVWSHKYTETGFWSSTYPGMLTTAGGVLFTGDPAGNFVALDAATGKRLWHVPTGATVSNTPETFTVDGHQYVTVASRDSLYAFYLQ